MRNICIAAVTAEYNPFHNGHAYQIARTREAGATHIVAVLGGNYLQRGEPALFEKRVRTHAALLGGADLVVELPLPRAMATAERFAGGSVALMQALGCVDMMSFGAENTLEELMPAVRALLDEAALGPAIRRHQEGGRTFAAARQLALAEQLGRSGAAVLERPNNILAIEYCKAAARLSFTPRLLAVPRFGAQHNSAVIRGSFASASALREIVLSDGVDALAPYVPRAVLEIYRANERRGLLPVRHGALESAMLPVLRRMTREDCATLPDLSEGLENRLYGAIRMATSLEGLYAAAKTKRYTASRIRRMALSAYLGLTERDATAPPPYLRVLGLNRHGIEVLAIAKETASLPLGSSLARLERQNAECARIARLEAISTDLYTLLLPRALPCGYEYTCKPVILK